MIFILFEDLSEMQCKQANCKPSVFYYCTFRNVFEQICWQLNFRYRWEQMVYWSHVLLVCLTNRQVLQIDNTCTVAILLCRRMQSLRTVLYKYHLIITMHYNIKWWYIMDSNTYRQWSIQFPGWKQFEPS